jgi:caa(3)-type oxidase subunit IV
MSTAVESNAKHYIGVWAWLVLALIASLGLGTLRAGPSVIFAIFAIALVKAFLVVSHFMHLKLEPRTWKVLMASNIGVLGCLFVGSFPDVSKVNGRIEEPVVAVPGGTPNSARGAVVATAAGAIDASPGDPAAGAKVYATFCVACHQPDGKGLNGKLAANFVDDKTRLAKTDTELLTSIANGFKGQVGQMPPWGPVLKPQQRRDVLAYVRQTFGGGGQHP